jgi:hypothetical protein
MRSAIATRTFAVSDVPAATQPLPEIPYHQAVAKFILAKKVEACSRYRGRLVSGVRSHPLIATLHTAFDEHRSICLSPDVIWLTILQGLAQHVNASPETLRKHFVRHEGTLNIKVYRDDFVKGSPENPWDRVFSEFSASIQEHIGDAHRVIIADFSTTGAVERAASEVALLDTMQAYFQYELHTRCGIPTIELEGTVDDWREIARRVQVFRDWGLDWWIDSLEPILDQFVAAAEDSIDRAFWESIYKWNGSHGSGSPYVSGWALNLFPYLNNRIAKWAQQSGATSDEPSILRNRWLGSAQNHNGPGRGDFPCLPSKAPFKWIYRDKTFDMSFVGGLIGMQQDEKTLFLRPEIGWAVLNTSDWRPS